ncbi:MAG: beta-propeller domain-containing protein, partial [Halobacteriota archaeon]|nr:beta-propeller domain-containing protein [Halobacteriota archaeon]
MNFKFVAVFFVLLVVATSGCMSNDTNGRTDYGPYTGTGVDLSKFVELEASQELKKFENRSEIAAFLAASELQSGRYGGYYSTISMREMGGSFATPQVVDIMVMEDSVSDSPVAPAATKSSGGSGESASEYSTTNIQVEGVDEADFVKNDDKYIYIISQDNLVIVDSYPADDAEIVSKTEIDGYPRDMFVNGDVLAIFSEGYDEVYEIADYDFVPRPRSVQST